MTEQKTHEKQKKTKPKPKLKVNRQPLV